MVRISIRRPVGACPMKAPRCVPLTVFRFIETFDGPRIPVIGRAFMLLPALAEAAFCVVAFDQLRNWAQWRRQRRILFFAWAVYFIAPFLVYVYPFRSAFDSIYMEQAAAQISEASMKAFRAVIYDNPRFVDYFFTARPIVSPVTVGAGVLTNVTQHAGAQTVRVALQRQNGHVRLTVADDGAGIADGLVEQRLAEGHLGVASQRVRVQAAGGRFSLHPGDPGTVAEVELPVP